MTPLKIHNCASYALMEYLTCWKCVIFHAVTASCFICNQNDVIALRCTAYKIHVTIASIVHLQRVKRERRCLKSKDPIISVYHVADFYCFLHESCHTSSCHHHVITQLLNPYNFCLR